MRNLDCAYSMVFEHRYIMHESTNSVIRYLVKDGLSNRFLEAIFFVKNICHALRMRKDFDEWNDTKKKLDNRKNGRTFKEREIWWRSIGLNIGYEIFGKNQFFNRPVLVLRKFSRFTFLGVPLTSNLTEKPYRHTIHINRKRSNLIFDQARCFDSRRLLNLEGMLTNEQFKEARKQYKSLM